jgi:DNA-binding NarL/FixJ family response regulator
MRSVLKELKDEVDIIEASDSKEAMSAIASNPDLDLVLLDLGLPDRNGFEALSEIREQHVGIPVAVLTASSAEEDIARALGLGAVGFVPKSASRAVTVGALKLILSGGVYIPPEILDGLTSRYKAAKPADKEDARPVTIRLGLTARQFDVLKLMMAGKSNKAICRELDLAEPTVKNHVTAILKALGATNRTEAVVIAGALGVSANGTTE